MDVWLLAPVLPLGVGGVFLGVGVWSIRHELAFLRRARRTRGVTLDPSSDTRVRFYTDEGEEVVTTPGVGSRPVVPKRAGRTVTVLYAPEAPSRVRLHGPSGTFLLPGVVLCLLGSLGVAAAFLVWWLMAAA